MPKGSAFLPCATPGENDEYTFSGAPAIPNSLSARLTRCSPGDSHEAKRIPHHCSLRSRCHLANVENDWPGAGHARAYEESQRVGHGRAWQYGDPHQPPSDGHRHRGCWAPRFFDAADSYGSHPHVAEALKHLSRDKVTVLTKSWARDPAGMRADLDRFRKELGTDYMDVFLMHCLTEGDWTERYKGVMEVLSEAKQKGVIRAHGCSCHSIEALRAAANSPWVEVDLARINPIQSNMDADPATVIGVLKQMKASGKAVVGMKILGAGDLRNRQDEALRYALSLGVLDAFTIGAENRAEQEDLIRRIAAA